MEIAGIVILGIAAAVVGVAFAWLIPATEEARLKADAAFDRLRAQCYATLNDPAQADRHEITRKILIDMVKMRRF